MNLDNAFASLRSILNTEALTERQREHLWGLIDKVSVRHPEVYLEQWLPYIEGFPHHLEEPLMLFRDWSRASGAAQRTGLPVAFHAFGVDDALIERIAGSPGLAGVMVLNLYGRYQSDGYRARLLEVSSIEALVSSPYIVNLELLELNSFGMRDEEAHLIANAPNLASLSRLHLERNAITDAGLDALLDSEHLAGLEVLEMFGNFLSDDGQGRLQGREASR